MQCRRPGFSPWVGKIPWRRAWKSTPVFLPGESQGWRSLVVSGHRVLFKSVPENWGLSACGTTHEATSRISSGDRPHAEVSLEGREPLADKAGESTHRSRSEGVPSCFSWRAGHEMNGCHIFSVASNRFSLVQWWLLPLCGQVHDPRGPEGAGLLLGAMEIYQGEGGAG